MAQDFDRYRVLTGDGFRATVESLDASLPALSVDEVAGVVGRLNRAVKRATREMHPEDAEETLILIEVIVDRVRRRARRQRSSGQVTAAVSTALGGGALATFLKLAPPGESVTFYAVFILSISITTALISARSATESGEWRSDVIEPLQSIAKLLDERIADTPASATYRDPASTRSRIAPTIADEEHDDAEDRGAAPDRSRRTR